jgi:hypothetical protein
VLIVKEKSPNNFEEVPIGASFVGSDGALHGWQCAELWSDTELAAVGVYRVQPAAPPTNPDVTVSGYHFERSGGVVAQILHFVLPPAPTKVQLKEYAAEKRYDREVAGMFSPTYGQLLTDRDTRAIIAQTIQSIDLGLVQSPINWKTPSGFVQLDRAALVGIAGEIAIFVQTTFDKESELDAKIESGEITDKVQIENAFAS